MRHRQRVQPCFDGSRKLWRDRTSLSAYQTCCTMDSLVRIGAETVEFGRSTIVLLQLSQAALGFSVKLHDFRQVGAVLATQVDEQLATFANFAKPKWVFVDAFGAVSKVSHDVVEFGARLQPAARSRLRMDCDRRVGSVQPRQHLKRRLQLEATPPLVAPHPGGRRHRPTSIPRQPSERLHLHHRFLLHPVRRPGSATDRSREHALARRRPAWPAPRRAQSPSPERPEVGPSRPFRTDRVRRAALLWTTSLDAHVGRACR